ncbi:DoxX family protein [Pontibacter diazotrophicus]|uniref:DoxX family protein n=1 Tax=Pontibacter diazotrophicus TaxID=1400979 RepID=A0A3D8LHI7_9BACT|nr:DoxX family protein [Pontibacter diazotrophicus]RDV16372.1 DoxX family protein [Pontibacter diazotrophicus]
MSLTQEVNTSSRVNSASNPVWMDGLRILLGLFLFFKGIMFLEHTSDVFYIFSQSQDVLDIKRASILTSVVHIVGGLMIAFGCLTRLALLCQFPILIGAVLIVNPQRGVQVGNTELWLSILVTCLLLFFMIVGPGRYSVDNKILRQKHPEAADSE